MKHFFNDAITIYGKLTVDEYGRETWGEGVPVLGRFVEKNKTLFLSKGETINCDAILHLPAETEIELGSKLIFNSISYRVINLVKPKDHFNVRFIKVYVEKYE